MRHTRRVQHAEMARFMLGLAICCFVIMCGIGLVWFVQTVVDSLVAHGIGG